jgi:hypothetical protein
LTANAAVFCDGAEFTMAALETAANSLAGKIGDSEEMLAFSQRAS